MKSILIFFLLLSFAASSNFKQNSIQTHVRSLNTILFFASEDIISSGHFRFKTFHTTLDNYFFPFSFPFTSDSEHYDYYVNGSIGFSKYIQKELHLFENIKDKYRLYNYAFKLGGGVQYHTSSSSDFQLGGSYIYSYLHGKYTHAPTDISDTQTKIIHTLLNENKHYHTFEISSAFSYHPTFNEYQPYATLSARHFSTHLDREITSKSAIKSTITQLKIGLITPPVAELFGLALTLEPYASVLHAFGDIENTLDLRQVYVLGNTFRLNAYPMTCWVEDFTLLKRDSMNWIREITFDLNAVNGNHFKGFNIGLGIKF